MVLAVYTIQFMPNSLIQRALAVLSWLSQSTSSLTSPYQILDVFDELRVALLPPSVVYKPHHPLHLLETLFPTHRYHWHVRVRPNMPPPHTRWFVDESPMKKGPWPCKPRLVGHQTS
jgi:hypothetical protein